MRQIIITIFILCSALSYAQLEFSNWYFGNKAAINFVEDGDASYLSDSSSFLNFMPATISDKEGNLLFYGNGNLIWDSSHNVMQNGDGLENAFSAYGSVIVPKPGSSNIYYYLYAVFDPDSNQIGKILFSEIDMTLNGGLGAVTSNKNISISDLDIGAKLTVAQHANDEDFWIVTHGINNANYYSFLIDDNGISNSPVISTNGNVHTGAGASFGGYLGQIKISHDVKRIATAYYTDDNQYVTSVDISFFNDQTGEVYGDVLTIGPDTFRYEATATDTGAAEFIEFSPNNQFLYISCINAFANAIGVWYPSALFQFDITNDNYLDLLSSQRLIDSGVDRYRGIEHGLDDKIYVVINQNFPQEDDNGVVRSIGVIEKPNLSGTQSDYQHLAFVLSEDENQQSTGSAGLPQDIRGFFYLNIKTDFLCSGQGRRFSLNASDEILGVVWDFGDGNTSTDLVAEHQFLPGTYMVTATVTFENSVIQRNVTVVIEEEVDLMEDITICDDASNDGTEEFDLGEIRSSIFRDETCGTVGFYLSEADAQAEINPLDDLFNNTINPQTVFVRVEVASNPGSVQITPINLVVDSFPTLLSNTLSICDDSSNDGFETVSLVQLNSQLSENIFCAEISYYLSENDANTGNDAISEEFSNTSNPQRIYVRIKSLRDDSYNVYPIDIVVKDQPNIDLNDVYYLCPNGVLEIEVDGDYDLYNWSTGSTSSSITVSETGTYSITASNITISGDCSDTKVISVVESAPATSVAFEVNDMQPDGNSIQVIIDGIGDYEYSLDSVNYQDSPIFEFLQLSEYIVFVRDKNGCGVVANDVKLLTYQKYFTPNNDGINDYWQIKSSFTEPDLTVDIFNRYGKLITSFSGDDLGWDGTFNGQELPVSDYWFVVHRPSQNKTYRGHFTLKR